MQTVRGRAALEAERAAEDDYGVEAVGAAVGAVGLQIGVAAYAEDALDASAVGSNHLVVDVPCAHAERLTGEEVLPRVGCGEAGQAEQSLLDHGYGVVHFASVLLRHLDLEIGVGRQFARGVDHGRQACGGVDHHQRHHAVHAHGQVVALGRVGLEHADADVDVGRHGGGGGQVEAGEAVARGDAVRLDDRRAVLDAHQRPSAPGRRECDLDAFAHTGGVGAQLHAQNLGGHARCAGLEAPRPVDECGGRCRVSAGNRDAEQVSAPIVGRHVDGERALAGVRVDGGVHDAAGAVGVGIVGQAARARLPPPAPVEAVDFAFDALDRERLAVGRERQHAYAVVGVGAEDTPVVAFGEADAHVAVVGRAGRVEAVDAEVAAALEHSDEEVGLHHAGAGLSGGQVDGGLGVAVGIEASVEDGGFGWLVGACDVVEDVVGIFVEGGDRRPERHGDAGVETAGRRAVEPSGGKAERAGLPHGEAASAVGLDPEPVGLDALDAQRLFEARGAHSGPQGVGARLGIGGGGGAEAQERAPVERLRVGRHDAAVWVSQFEADGHVARQRVEAVLEHHAHEDAVARAPHSALAVDEGLEAVVDRASLHVEARERQRLGVAHGQIAALGAVARHQQMGRAGVGYGRFALAVGAPRAYYLILKVVDVDVDALERRGGRDVGEHDEHAAVVPGLGHYADVGSQQVDAHDVLVVVHRVAGIVALPPVPLEVVGAEEVVAHVSGPVPYLLLAGKVGGIVGGADAGVGRGVGAGVDGVAPAEREDDAVDGAGVGLHHLRQVNRKGVPLREVELAVLGKVERLLGHQTAGAVQGVGVVGAKAVALQECRQVALEQLYHPDFDAAQADGAERQHQPRRLGQYVARRQQFDLRADALEADGEFPLVVEGHARGADYAPMDHEGVRALHGLERIDLQLVAVHKQAHRHVAHGHEAAQVLRGLYGHGERQLRIAVGIARMADHHHLKAADRRDGEILVRQAGLMPDFARVDKAQRRGLVEAADAEHGQRVLVGAELPLQLQRPALLLGAYLALHQLGRDAVAGRHREDADVVGQIVEAEALQIDKADGVGKLAHLESEHEVGLVLEQTAHADADVVLRARFERPLGAQHQRRGVGPHQRAIDARTDVEQSGVGLAPGSGSGHRLAEAYADGRPVGHQPRREGADPLAECGGGRRPDARRHDCRQQQGDS